MRRELTMRVSIDGRILLVALLLLGACRLFLPALLAPFMLDDGPAFDAGADVDAGR